MKNYFNELKRTMNYVAGFEDTVFLGQAVAEKGTAMRNTLVDIDPAKLIELPVAEDMQMGMTNGLALQGKIPVSIFPRWNFFLLAMNQLANHLDKIPDMSTFETKAIIRVGIGAQSPMHPGHQHIGDLTEVYQKLLKNVEVIRLDSTEDIFPAYQKALVRVDGKSTILVEWSDAYDDKWEVPPYRLQLPEGFCCGANK
jgi:pyruvate/2-oxoglutarate/acetoin dehydrogenase E1 component